jgi:intraflagellar transport protein 46
MINHREYRQTDKPKEFAFYKYDEAVDVSQSMDQSNLAMNKDLKRSTYNNDVKSESNTLHRDSEQSKSHGILNKPFDEALELSQSGSDDSVDTRNSEKKGASTIGKPRQADSLSESKQPSSMANQRSMGAAPLQSANNAQREAQMQSLPNKSQHGKTNRGDDDESSEEEGDQEESYDNIVGAYSAKDYANLNVSAEVRDLFQYIERYKPHEVELESTLKCFIPEYIPAIGEMDAFIKVPRPDKKEEELGLKFLDEPSASQSDPTVLELQLRALSKKLQYGDVVVRSIENAAKNPAAIDKWINSISDLHRSKPPPQVHYRRNMPNIDDLLDVWPEAFETALETLKLPSPDLDVSLAEYSKILCSILDIPTYENPIESLHQMFSLFMDFRNNPHFQVRDIELEGRGYGADVMNVDPSYK